MYMYSYKCLYTIHCWFLPHHRVATNIVVILSVRGGLTIINWIYVTTEWTIFCLFSYKANAFYCWWLHCILSLCVYYECTWRCIECMQHASQPVSSVDVCGLVKQPHIDLYNILCVCCNITTSWHMNHRATTLNQLFLYSIWKRL